MKKLVLLFLLVVFFSEGMKGQATLSLENALSIGLESNYDIRIVRNEAAIAVNDNTPGNAGILPNVAVYGEYNVSNLNTEQRFFTGESRSAEGAVSKGLVGGVELNWTLFDGFRMFAALNRLGQEEIAGELNYRARVESYTADVYATYYRLLAEEELLEVYRRTLTLSRERLELVEKQAELGGASDIERIQVSFNHNEDSALVISQRYLIENLKADLNALLGRDVTTPIAVTGDFNVDRNLEYETLRNTLSDQNTSLLLARTREEIRRQELREAESVYLPQIGAFASYDYARSVNEVGILATNRTFGPSFGLRVNWNIFNGFTARREIANQRLLLENAAAEEAATEIEVNRALTSYFSDYKAALEQLNLEEGNLEGQRNLLNIAMRRLDLGSMSNIEFREFQLSLARAENRLVTAEYMAKLAEINLLLTAGRLRMDQ